MNKNIRKKIVLLLITALFLVPCSGAGAWSSFRDETGAGHANTTFAKTPITPEMTGTKWQIKFSETQATAYNSVPIISSSNIYIVCKNILYKMDMDGTILSSLSLAKSMNSICNMSLYENKLYIPLSSGTMQCVSTDTFSSLWISEEFGLQSLTTAYCRDGLVYAGTTNADGSDGLYYCLDAGTGKTIWTYKNESSPCGYYWSGAISTGHSAESSALLMGGDNGILVSHSLTEDKVYDTFPLSDATGSSGSIRAGITYNSVTDAYYTTTNNGYLYKIKMNADGSFDSVNCVFLGNTPSASVNCTSTPTIYNNRIYVCSYYNSQGLISVIDAVSMKQIYSVTCDGLGDIKSSPLVSTAYASELNHDKVYVYFTVNFVPGGIYYIEDDSGAYSSEIKTLFEPETGKQFCMSSIAAGPDGTLYYSNDSGTLFAVNEGCTPINSPQPSSPAVPPISSAVPNTTTQTASPITPKADLKQVVKPQKPTKIKYRIKKRKNKKYTIIFTWKKGKDSKKTLIKIYGKKRFLLSGRKKSILLKKGTYTIYFYGYRSNSCKSSPAKIKISLK